MGAYSEQYGKTISLPTGRYGEDFVEKRREKLERWTNRVARHPVLSRSEVMGHFLLCDDEGVSELWRVGRKPPEISGFRHFKYLSRDSLPATVLRTQSSPIDDFCLAQVIQLTLASKSAYM